MSYKTILVHVDESARLGARIDIAARIALHENAHLVGVGLTGVSPFVGQNVIIESGDGYINAYIDTLRLQARAGLALFDRHTANLELPSVERRLVDDETAGGICLQARYADLVVLGQTDPAEPDVVIGNDFPEFVSLQSGCPVLIVPYAGTFDDFGRNPIIAWDGSRQARHAVCDALPLLQRAAQVEIAVFNAEERTGTHGPQPGADIAIYLTRHGIRVNVHEAVVPHDDIGNALLSRLADTNADLLVMGCYGHSRLREIVLGGVTRTILSAMTVPVLMSH